jgi:hypothetical protein
LFRRNSEYSYSHNYKEKPEYFLEMYDEPFPEHLFHSSFIDMTPDSNEVRRLSGPSITLLVCDIRSSPPGSSF